MSKSFELLDIGTHLDAAAVRADLLLTVVSSYRSPAWVRLVFLAALRGDEQGVAVFAPGELVELLGVQETGGHLALSKILGRAIRGGYVQKGSTAEMIALDSSKVAVWHKGEGAA